MIIDSHGHIVMPDVMYKFMGELAGNRANPISSAAKIPEAALRKAAEENIARMDSVGTDIQFLSPRPYIQMHSIRPSAVTATWTRFVNNAIHQQVQMFPTRFRGIAGLPQFRKDSPRNCLDELERCVNELGFVGCLLNPDPTEGEELPPAGLGDPHWYPLYEKLVELDVPALVHSAGSCSPRESYTLKFINEESIAIISLLDSDVFKRFPTLKLVISHGGGAIPYHMGRFRAWNLRRNEPEAFDFKIRRLYFDTCNYSKESLEFQFKVLGTDNCLFGTERPGTGTVHNPATGSDFDHLRPLIEGIEWLTESDKKKIFEDNCRRLYTRAFR